MKKQKLQLKDEMLKILQQESVKRCKLSLPPAGALFNNCMD